VRPPQSSASEIAIHLAAAVKDISLLDDLRQANSPMDFCSLMHGVLSPVAGVI
jgi:hypothetical protein